MPKDPAYKRRIFDDELDELLCELPAILIEGPKAVGKTSTALQRAETVHLLDQDGPRALAEADPDRLLTDSPPVLIDEWQNVDSIWNTVRRAVDAKRPGQFLLTGSSSTVKHGSHSGAGMRCAAHCCSRRA